MADGTTTATYAYGTSLLRKDGETPLFDGLGSERTVTNTGGSVTASLTLSAFGGTVTSSGSSTDAYQFGATSGYRSDGDAGLVKVGARYYDPQVGRFTTRDTVLTEKPYVYCDGYPVNAVDPSGHHWSAFHMMWDFTGVLICGLHWVLALGSIWTVSSFGVAGLPGFVIGELGGRNTIAAMIIERRLIAPPGSRLPEEPACQEGSLMTESTDKGIKNSPLKLGLLALLVALFLLAGEYGFYVLACLLGVPPHRPSLSWRRNLGGQLFLGDLFVAICGIVYLQFLLPRIRAKLRRNS